MVNSPRFLSKVKLLRRKSQLLGCLVVRVARSCAVGSSELSYQGLNNVLETMCNPIPVILMSALHDTDNNNFFFGQTVYIFVK